MFFFRHVMVGANELDESKKFYDALLGALGVPPGINEGISTPGNNLGSFDKFSAAAPGPTDGLTNDPELQLIRAQTPHVFPGICSHFRMASHYLIFMFFLLL